ncbi:MAG: lipid A biosynthesis acyltransferase, partial [Gammaproteobacteria bacterium]|nr:lipid A biosynthesis acyltransferase [Gammaproteobacteria bacterium]
WLTWLGLGLLRAIEPLPYKWQLHIGRLLGRVIGLLPLSYFRIARRNIEICLPELTPAERGALLKRHIESLGIGLCETAITWWSPNERVRALAQVEGLEHLQRALARGRGAILVGGHFTTIEIGTRILGTVVPLNVLYRPTRNEVLSVVMAGKFAFYGQRAIRYDDIRTLVRALKENGAVWYAPDQSYRNKGAAMLPFFGTPAATATATSRLARMTGAAVLTYFPQRLPGAQGYRVFIGPELENFPSDDPIADTVRFGALLEAQIRHHPEQYLWMHRRFKGLSPDYPDYYGRDTRRRRA